MPVTPFFSLSRGRRIHTSEVARPRRSTAETSSGMQQTRKVRREARGGRPVPCRSDASEGGVDGKNELQSEQLEPSIGRTCPPCELAPGSCGRPAPSSPERSAATGPRGLCLRDRRSRRRSGCTGGGWRHGTQSCGSTGREERRRQSAETIRKTPGNTRRGGRRSPFFAWAEDSRTLGAPLPPQENAFEG